jgi:hypothetical protein
MNNWRFLAVSVTVLLALWLGIWYKNNPLLAKNYFVPNHLTCDSTLLGQYNVFEIGKILYASGINVALADSLVLEINNNEGNKKSLRYNKKSNGWEVINLNLTPADSIAITAQILANTNLHSRWAAILAPFRTSFIHKRDKTLGQIPIVLEGHRYRISSDIRLAENQAALLKQGKSAAALSLHQFGLASDIAISRGSTYITSFGTYKKLGQLAENEGLTWGGSFVGFIDPNHVQLFRNSAQMLAQIPTLAFEYQPFASYYQQRVEKFTKAGKAKSVEDSAELLQILAAINEGKMCSCSTKPMPNNTTMPKGLLKIVFDETQKQMLVSYNDQIAQFKLGTWQ